MEQINDSMEKFLVSRIPHLQYAVAAMMDMDKTQHTNSEVHIEALKDMIELGILISKRPKKLIVPSVGELLGQG
jgi:hypothetical protein